MKIKTQRNLWIIIALIFFFTTLALLLFYPNCEITEEKIEEPKYSKAELKCLKLTESTNSTFISTYIYWEKVRGGVSQNFDICVYSKDELVMEAKI